VWRNSELFADLRRPQTGGACASCSFFDSCQGGCMAAKFFTGLPLDGPDPECVRGFGEQAARSADTAIPKSDVDHSRPAPRNVRTPKGPVPLALSVRPSAKLDRACDENPLAARPIWPGRAGAQPARSQPCSAARLCGSQSHRTNCARGGTSSPAACRRCR
jgi:hypothetical protein